MLVQTLFGSLSVTSVVTVVVPLSLLYSIGWVIYARTLHPLSKVPGPFLASVSRLWIMKNILPGSIHHVERALHQRYGPIVRVAPDEVVCIDPDAVRKIYPYTDAPAKTDFYLPWASGRITFSKHLDLFSEQSNKKHGERRRIVNHVYSLGNILRFEPFLDECCELFITRMGGLADAGQAVDLGQWLQWYTFDVIGQLFFGSMFGFMKHSHDHENWIQALDKLVPFIAAMSVSPAWARPLIRMSAMFSKAARDGLDAMALITEATRSSVARRQAVPAFGADGAPRQDILQQMLDLSREKGEKVDFSVGDIQVDAHVAIFAGSDTTAAVLRGVMYYLMRNPQLYYQVQSEIDQAAEKGELSTSFGYSEAIRLPLLGATIKEAMRLQPSVGMSMPRFSPKGGMELAGVYIPEGYRVGVSPANLAFDKSIFGPDADQFRPSRWLNDNDAIYMDKYMLNFGAGARTCIGKHIALCEVYKLIPHLLRDFNVELVNPGKEWRTINMFIHKQVGIEVRVKRRQH